MAMTITVYLTRFTVYQSSHTEYGNDYNGEPGQSVSLPGTEYGLTITVNLARVYQYHTEYGNDYNGEPGSEL